MTTSSRLQLLTPCPEWCTDDRAEHAVFDDDGDRLHRGPLFGTALRGWGMEADDGRTWTFTVDDAADGQEYVTPAELLALAEAAREAAAWIEAQATRPGRVIPARRPEPSWG